MSDVKGIVFLKTYYDSISKIKNKETQNELFHAIFRYAFYEEEPETENDIVLALFENYRYNIDQSISKYKTKVERMNKNREQKKTKQET